MARTHKATRHKGGKDAACSKLGLYGSGPDFYVSLEKNCKPRRAGAARGRIGIQLKATEGVVQVGFRARNGFAKY